MNFDTTNGECATVQCPEREKAIGSDNTSAAFEHKWHFDLSRTACLNPTPTTAVRTRANRFKFARLAKALSSPAIARLSEESRSVLAHIKNITNEMERL